MPPDPQTSNEPDPAEAEKAFWEKLTGTLDSWFDGKMKSYEEAHKNDPPARGTSRTGGKRATLPTIIADIVWPEKD